MRNILFSLLFAFPAFADNAPVAYDMGAAQLYYNNGSGNVYIPTGSSPSSPSGYCVRFADYYPEGDGVDDDSAEFDLFLDAVKASDSKTGCLDAGTFRFTTQADDIDSQVHLIGSGMGRTIILRDYNGTSGKGILAITEGANGTKIEGMSIIAKAGTTGGAALSIKSTSSYATSFITLENLNLSTFGSNSYDNTVIIDGTAKTSAPTGVRDISFKNVHIFGANGFSLSLQSVNGFSYHGGGVYPAGGTNAASGGIAIGGTSTNKSNYMTISLPACNGLNLTNSSYGLIDCTTIGAISGVSINNDTSAAYYRTRGTPTGSVLGNWQFSRHD